MAVVDGIVSTLVGGLMVNVITKLGTEAIREFGSAWGVKEEVEHLKNTVATIQDYLADAEQKQLADKKVGIWLTRIKDAVYKAEDIIDEFITEAERRKLAKQDKLFKTSKSHSGFRFKTARRIKQVRETLRRIKDDQPSGLIHHTPEQNSVFIPMRPETHSRLTEPKVVGRDKERDEIVKLLLDSSGGDTISVIPIIGMGGIGKTTFAKYVYNHNEVVDHFKDDKGVINRWWVCVSNDDTGVNAVQTITKKIIESVAGEKCPDLQLDLLQTRLGSCIKGKRFLLVLDDVWNENEYQWRELRGLLSGGASGSKIIVTTRSERVGSITFTNSQCKLSELSDGYCWELFKSIAFSKAEEKLDLELVKIGRAIVSKCGGLPLAARVLGGLCYQAKKERWVSVRDHEIWKLPQEKNDILSELMISYYYLPIQLKNCFAYCSIFPKNYRIEKDMLIQYWIAHGLIYSSRVNEPLEDVGNNYIEVLISRSFFQEAEFDNYDNLLSFKMHDLVNDLAKFVAGVEFFTVCEDVKKFPNGIRHLFFDIEVLSSHLVVISKQIRTLVFSSKIKNFDGEIFSKLKFLRVLQFNDDCIDHLPNSIGNLKHLRYLQIECGHIKELPESITNLQNLQVLNLECEMLERLPGSIRKMISLKHICLKCPLLSHMPLGLKELTSLQTLSRFIVSNDNVGCELNELNGLINLGGALFIENLDNVKNAKESEKTNLKTKSNLQYLGLYWGRANNNRKTKYFEPLQYFILYWGRANNNRETIDFEVLRNLEPHPNLKYLLMKGYLGLGFPCWMMDPLPSLSNVVGIILDECERCEKLPPFRRLPSLKVLILSGISGARCFEDNLEQSSRMEWFPSLTRLVIESALNLESWVAMEKQEEEKGLFLLISFPRLVSLTIMDCPQLKNMPRLPSVVDLTLDDISDELLHSIWNPNCFSVAMEQPLSLSNLVNISIRNCIGCKQLPPFSRLPSLKFLQLERMYDLQCFQGELEASQKEWFPSLIKLVIRYAPNLESWVVTGQQQGRSLPFSFPCLVELDITDCPNLKNMPCLLPSVEDLSLWNISDELVHSIWNPNCFSVAMEQPPSLSKLVYIHISKCRGCKQLPPFSRLPSLKSLRLFYMYDLECFEGELEASQKEWFPSLIQLDIRDAPNLESWVVTGQHQQQWLSHSFSFPFPRLVQLSIWICPKLKNMPRLPCIEQVSLLQCSGEVVHSVFNPTSSLVTLKRLEIIKCDDLECLPEYPAHYLSSLEELRIWRCESLNSWPNWLGHQLTSLIGLRISCSSKLQFLPEQILHLAALQKLTIHGYSEETLPDSMENLTSLQTLYLLNCPNLQILPEWALRVNTTIQHLGIGGCPLLKLRYNKETGEDRGKLTHIKSVYFIDNRWW